MQLSLTVPVWPSWWLEDLGVSGGMDGLALRVLTSNKVLQARWFDGIIRYEWSLPNQSQPAPASSGVSDISCGQNVSQCKSLLTASIITYTVVSFRRDSKSISHWRRLLVAVALAYADTVVSSLRAGQGGFCGPSMSSTN